MMNTVRKAPRRQKRPYPKADITIEDQEREQRQLLDAAKAFQGYKRSDLSIIAISYEHKCFAEATCKDEYIAKIRKKLVEWKFVPGLESLPAQSGPTEAPSLVSVKQPGQHLRNRECQKLHVKPVRSHHQRHQSGPPTHSSQEYARIATQAVNSAVNMQSNKNGVYSKHLGLQQTPNSNDAHQHIKGYVPQHPSYPHQENSIDSRGSQVRPGSAGQSHATFEGQDMVSAYSNHNSPQLQAQSAMTKLNGSPRSQPMSHSITSMSDTSSNSSAQENFVDIFNPKFLSTIDLNDPRSRTMWVSSVWEYFRSGGQWNAYGSTAGDSTLGSQSNSPVPAHNLNDNGSFQSHSVDIKAEFDAIAQARNDVEMMDHSNDFPYHHRLGNITGRRSSVDSGLSGNPMHHLRRGHLEQSAGNDASWELHSLNLQLGMNNMDGVIVGDPPMNGLIENRNFEKWMSS